MTWDAYARVLVDTIETALSERSGAG
jgi:hypothetical protein